MRYLSLVKVNCQVLTTAGLCRQYFTTSGEISQQQGERLQDDIQIIRKINLKNGFYDTVTRGKVVVDEPNYLGMGEYFRDVLNVKWNDSISFIYNGRNYEIISKNSIREMILDLTLGKCKQLSHLIGFLEFIRARCNFTSTIKPPNGYINLNNGVLNVQTRELLPHDPKYGFQYCLPHNYDPQAVAPEWNGFLLRIFDGDQQLADLSAEIFGYILSGGNPFLHKAFILYGEGRNGKSTWLDVLKYLIGNKNVSAIPLENLEKPFSAVMADGKLVNITGELTTREVSSSAFKTAVSGEELVAAQKGMPEYMLPFHARLVFATNKPPFFRDATTGSHEKLCLMPFKHYIRPEDRLPLYAQTVLFPEISGVLNWALDGLNRLMKTGQLTDAGAVREEVEEYRESSDSVLVWCKEFVKPLGVTSSSPIGYQIKDYFVHYKNWCDAESLRSVSVHEFGRRVVSFVKTWAEVVTPKNRRGRYLSGRVMITASKDKISNYNNLQIEMQREEET